MSPPLLIVAREAGSSERQLAVTSGRVSEEPHPDALRIDVGDAAVLPGLHDHHVHLLAMAARATSEPLGSPAVTSASQFDQAIRAAHTRLPAGEWLRGVDHEEETGGALDRARLDALAPGRPVRVQHRSGALWTLNTPALEAVGLGGAPDDRPPGVELDAVGRPTGRLWRLDDWLRERVPSRGGPDLAPVGAAFAARGVTGVTDATASDDPGAYGVLAQSVRSGELPLGVTVTGGVAVADVRPPEPLRWGPVKLIIADHDEPDLDAVTAGIAAAHAAGRAVAIHCVTRTAAAVAIAAWDVAGSRPGDRMEHGSVLDLAAARELSRLGVTVVTQPSFVHGRGDHYLAEVDPADIADLYRCASLLSSGVAVAGSSDAPHGDPDPWRSIAAATIRRTAGGRSLGADEAVTAAAALELFLGTAEEPGGPARRLGPGSAADLCALDRPLDAALADPAAVNVVLTVHDGVITHRAV